jgi:hypothetical protein
MGRCPLLIVCCLLPNARYIVFYTLTIYVKATYIPRLNLKNRLTRSL